MSSSLNLFQISNRVAAPASSCRAELETPLGSIRLSLEAGGTVIDMPAEACFVGETYRLMSWERPLFHAELFIADVAVELPADMTISGCQIGVWRLRAKSAFPECRFSATWAHGTAPGEGGPDGGQCLIAQTWHDGETTVSLGTSDAEFMNRIGTGWEIPVSWRRLVAADPESVVVGEYRDDGLLIALPGLAPCEGGQVHFAAAWSPTRPLNGESGTWFAVDLNPVKVLDNLKTDRRL